MRYPGEPLWPEEFEEGTDYTPAELEAFATGWLVRDRQGTEALSDLGKKIVSFLERSKKATLYEMRGLGKPLEIIREVAALTEGERLTVARDQHGARDVYSLVPNEETAWLTDDQIAYRKAAEIYSTSGEVDPSYVSGMYWRPYPNGGREIFERTEENKKSRRGFYGRHSPSD